MWDTGLQFETVFCTIFPSIFSPVKHFVVSFFLLISQKKARNMNYVPILICISRKRRVTCIGEVASRRKPSFLPHVSRLLPDRSRDFSKFLFTLVHWPNVWQPFDLGFPLVTFWKWYPGSLVSSIPKELPRSTLFYGNLSIHASLNFFCSTC